MAETNAELEAKKAELWKRGVLTWKLKPVQLRMYQDIKKAISEKKHKYVINSSRRLGKSYLLLLIACEYAIQNPDVPVRYTAPTRLALKKIAEPIMREILKDCPPELRPVYKRQEAVYVFPGGGEIHLSGANKGHAENQRGTAASIFLVDEAGFVDELEYLVDDVAMPQLLTTGGILILSSTPPKTPAHDFGVYAQQAQLDGNYSKFTIYDAGYAAEIIEEFKKEAGGENSTTWKREYLAEFVVDSESAIIGEWKDDYAREWPADEYYRYYHRYDGLDIGTKDFTACLFGYYDYGASKLVIQDELIMNGPAMTTEKLAAAIKAKEAELYTWGNQPISPYRRIADNNNLLLLQDMGQIYDIHFAPTNKEALEAMVNEVKIMVGQGRIVVHPRCVQLIGCLKNGVWDNRRKKFERSKVYGHFDALAALIYLVRNLDQVTNPVPADYGLNPAAQHIDYSFRKNPLHATVKSILGLGKRIS